MGAPRIIFGVDPGTSITGYGIISCQGRKMELLSCGVIRLDRLPTNDHPAKLKRIFERVNSLIKEYQPTEMAIEAPFYGKNVQSMLKLGRAQGVAMAAGITHGLQPVEYAPRKVKLAVTGSGSASKEQVAGMLRKLLSFTEEPRYQDATDGLAVAVCHFFQNKNFGEKANYKGWGGFIKANPDRLK